MDKPAPMRRPARRLVYAFLALLPLAGCGVSPTAPGNGKNGHDNAGSASDSDRPVATGPGAAAGMGLAPR